MVARQPAQAFALGATAVVAFLLIRYVPKTRTTT
jgi:hypothetical protein